MKRKYNFNARTLTMPLAAFTMASLLFVYARTSIQAAKRNAQKHREADGGEISWRNESLRRHGAIEPPETQNSVKQLLGIGTEKASVVKERTDIEKIRRYEEERVKEAVRNKGRKGIE